MAETTKASRSYATFAYIIPQLLDRSAVSLSPRARLDDDSNDPYDIDFNDNVSYNAL